MKAGFQIAAPPSKSLIIFDGECNFCALWIRRWRQTTGDGIDYLPFQDPLVAERFPEVPREGFGAAVHLIETDASVYSGAEAAFRALAHNPRERWLLDWYQHSPLFARASEGAYRFVASHRSFFSALTRLAWGNHIEQPTYGLTRWIFLRSLGLIYLVAFLSLWVQIIGLVGADGILPAKLTLQAERQQAVMAHLGWELFHLAPTLCWFSASDTFLKSLCAAGTALALLLTIGFAPAPCLFLLWMIYLSLATVCREFLGFQWDNLLLEMGLLAIFLAPLQLFLRWNDSQPPSRLVLWLFRWLLFRLMLASGCVKLLSGDPTWRDLTALHFHYETQPLPTWIGWYAHQLPAGIQKSSTALMFGIELVLPLLVFAPRRLRQIPCVAFIALQTLIFLTGNYCFFNLLTIVLCLLLLDDFSLQRLLPVKRQPSGVRVRESKFEVQGSPSPTLVPQPSILRWTRVLLVPLTCVAILIPLMQFCGMFHLPVPWPRPLLAIYGWVGPFRSFNHYGLFAVMTTSRPEIIIEGSNDGVNWSEYEFKYKPGDLKRRPVFVEPHQPRLDWQMWFAALTDYRHNPWLVSFCVRLLQGSREVLALLARNPFPDSPPRYIRAVLYEYRFTDIQTRHQTGAWWRRERLHLYLPPISVQQNPSGGL